MTADVTFKAMGCRSRVVVHDGADDVLAAWAVERLELLEALWSRFRGLLSNGAKSDI